MPRARLQFLAPTTDQIVTAAQPTYQASQAGGAIGEHDGAFAFHDVDIRDARDRDLSLDRNGFALYPHRSAVTDFFDDTALATIYDAEAKALIKRLTGGTRVEVFDHTRRAASDQLRRATIAREPSGVTHNDYTENSAPQRVRDLFPAAADRLLARRFAIVNIWRPLVHPVFDQALAFCDSETVAPTDLVNVKRQAKDRIGEIQMAHFNEAQRWYYFPQMQVDEVALIKTYDSALDGTNRFTIHTAFADPDAPTDKPPRQSLETRCFVFY